MLFRSVCTRAARIALLYTAKAETGVSSPSGGTGKETKTHNRSGREGYHGRLPVNHDRQTLPTPAIYTLALRRQT